MKPSSLPATAAPPLQAPWRDLVLLAAAGLALRLFLVWSGWCDQYVIADDAYYYFQITRNILLGHGSTFDRLALTNGYHPLWLVVLIPTFALAGATSPSADPWLLAHLAVTLGAVLEVIAGVLLFALVRHAFPGRAPTWAAALWLLSPITVLLGLRGLEGSLNAALVAACLLVALRAMVETVPGVRRAAGIGALAGLATLARTDNVPLLGGALAVMLALAAARARAAWGRALAAGAVMAVTALVVVSPWLAWNVRTFGSPLQVSAMAKMHNPAIYGHLPTAGGRWAPGRVVRSLAAFVWTPATYVAGEEFDTTPRVTRVISAVTLGGIALAAIVVWRRRRRLTRAQVSLLAGAATWLTLHVLAYAFVLRSYMTWYAEVPFLLVSALGGIALGGGWLERAPRAWRLIVAGVGAIASLVVMLHFFDAKGIVPGGPRQEIVATIAAAERRAPELRTLGIYNAGALAWFAPPEGRLHVVNLDCLVNNAAFDAWRHGTYAEYVDHTVDLLLLSPPGDEPRAWMPRARWERLLRDYPIGADTSLWFPEARFYGPRRGLRTEPGVPSGR